MVGVLSLCVGMMPIRSSLGWSAAVVAHCSISRSPSELEHRNRPATNVLIDAYDELCQRKAALPAAQLASA
jgi:hypothetical protein